MVVDGLDPRREQLVEPCQVSDRGGVDLDEELLSHRAEDPLDLPPAFRFSWSTVDETHPEHRARSQQRARHETGSIVEVNGFGQAPSADARPQCRRGAHRVLRDRPPIAHQRPGVIVQERHQHRPPPGDDRADQAVADPQFVDRGSLETTERHRLGGQVAAVQAHLGEMALQGTRPGRPPLGLQDDPGDLGAGALGVLPAQRARQVQDRHRSTHIG